MNLWGPLPFKPPITLVNAMEGIGDIFFLISQFEDAVILAKKPWLQKHEAAGNLVPQSGKQMCAGVQFAFSFLVSWGPVIWVVVSTNLWWVFLPRLT